MNQFLYSIEDTTLITHAQGLLTTSDFVNSTIAIMGFPEFSKLNGQIADLRSMESYVHTEIGLDTMNSLISAATNISQNNWRYVILIKDDTYLEYNQAYLDLLKSHGVNCRIMYDINEARVFVGLEPIT